MNIQFFGETRKQFADENIEGTVPVLGSFPVKEIMVNEKWQTGTKVTISFTASIEWCQNNLFPGRNPANIEVPYRRARYFTFRKENNQLSTMILEDCDVVHINADEVEVTAHGMDPRLWFETMSSSTAMTGDNWVTERLTIANWLSQRVSNARFVGMEEWQALPATILKYNYTPTPEEAAIGIRTPTDVAPAGNIEIGVPDPLPIKNAVDDLFATWNDAELYPIDKFGQDGTESPWWQWAIRTRILTNHTFSEFDGSMKLNKYSVNWRETETLAYSSNDPTKFSYATGKTSAKDRLYGPWAGIKPESFTPPENANIDNFLRSKAITGTMDNSRLVIDCTVDFSKKGITPVCGMWINVRIGSKIYQAEVNEVSSHFSYETGWTSSSPVFVDMDSIDLSDPIESERDIKFTINGDSFIIPTGQDTASYYSWRVYVNETSYGVYQGTSNLTSPGIELLIGEPGNHEITIQPSDNNYVAGWGRAFGFGGTSTSSSSPVNSLSNRDKLIGVTSDPDFAHLLSDEDAGDNFKADQFYYCRNLVNIVPEDMPNTVKTIGNYFRSNQYYRSQKLTFGPSEHISSITETIGDYFRYQQYRQNTFSSPAQENFPDTVESIGSNFRDSQYYQSANISVAANEEFHDNEITIGSYFRNRQYYSCANLIVAGKEIAPNAVDLNDSYRNRQYSLCSNLITVAEEVLSSSTQVVGTSFRSGQYQNTAIEISTPEVNGSIQIIGDYYRASQYYGCSKLTTIFDEQPVNAAEIPGGFKESQYENCTSLMTPAIESMSSVVNTIGSSFKSSQYSGCSKLISSPNEVLNNNITSIDHSFRMQQFYNCVALTTIGEEAFPLSCTRLSLQKHRYSQYENVSTGIAPDEAAMPSLTTSFNPPGNNNLQGYRQYQYYGSKIMEIGKEADFPDTFTSDSSTNFRYAQYMNCPNIKNDRLLSEGSTQSFSTYYRSYRSRQFMNSGIIHPLKENDALTVTTGGSAYTDGLGYRESMYENCYYLQEAAAEQDRAPWKLSIYSNRSYRPRQYYNCIAIDPRNKNLILKNAVDTSIIGTGTAYRREQFANTIAKNLPGERILYLDGTEVVEGQDYIQSDFYTD